LSFNSYTFLYFFFIFYPIYIGIRYFNVPWKWLVLISSWFFYSWAYPPCFFLLLFSTLVNFYCGKAILEQPLKAKYFLKLSLFANLGVLCFFKYTTFLLANLSYLSAFNFTGFSIILPIGISFYTFQSMSYTIDIYRGKLTKKKDFLDFALYVSFFPQLVAGPILFATHFLEQLNNEFKLSKINWERGFISILSGAVLKLVIADGLAPEVDAFFLEPSNYHTCAAWYYLFAYSAQIFCDFAGYSSIAIGLSTIMGFHIPRNFNSPYFSISIKDFWKRWHISLSTWLREYLYISLGGNRNGWYKTLRNLLITMLLGGLWHGAGWNFIIWGALHGVALAINHSASILTSQFSSNLKKVITLFSIPTTLFFVMICWVFFRSSSLNQVYHVLDTLWPSNFDLGRSVDYREKDLLLWFLLHHIISAFGYEKIKKYISRPIRLIGIIFLLELLYTSRAGGVPFIYFSF